MLKQEETEVALLDSFAFLPDFLPLSAEWELKQKLQKTRMLYFCISWVCEVFQVDPSVHISDYPPMSVFCFYHQKNQYGCFYFMVNFCGELKEMQRAFPRYTMKFLINRWWERGVVNQRWSDKWKVSRGIMHSTEHDLTLCRGVWPWAERIATVFQRVMQGYKDFILPLLLLPHGNFILPVPSSDPPARELQSRSCFIAIPHSDVSGL